MKLFTKICMIAAAIAAVLGIIGVGVGMTMGAGLEDLNDIGVYISPYQQVKVTGVKIMKEDSGEELLEEQKTENDYANSHHGIGIQHHNRQLNEELCSYTCSLQDIERLKVEAENAQITIFATEETDNIIYYSNKEDDISERNGSTLKIEDNSSLNNQLELEIYLPIDVLKEIEIDASAGEFSADRIIADTVSIEIDSASVQIEELVVNRKAELQVDAGEMVIGYFDGAKLEAECAMGAMMIVCEGNKKDYNYELECGMGNIQIQEESYSGIGEDIKVNNGGEKFINAECGMGEIILEFPNDL